MRRQLEGSQAVAEAVARCRPQVISAYPISPQTHIVEALSDRVRTGELAPCEFVNVESEFAAMSVAIGASAAGSRAYTATASQGLLYMAEALYNASGLGLPIVMTVANRALGAPINIWNDHSDAMSQRDCGWIQLYAETNQEAVDLHVQAFRIAEELSLPVMVCMDGFVLTHAYEPLDVPTQEQVDAFLPPFEPRQQLDPDEPVTIGAMVGPEAFSEVKYLAHAKQMLALELIPAVAREFERVTGRDSGGLVRRYRTDDAETIVVALGSVLGTIEDTVDELRAQGVRVGALGDRRPFELTLDQLPVHVEERERSQPVLERVVEHLVQRALRDRPPAESRDHRIPVQLYPRQRRTHVGRDDAADADARGRMIAANATGCLEVFSTPYPESAWTLPWIHSLFGNAPAVASGIAAALKAQGRTDVRVVGQGGDGGTLDIGFGCLSGMFERGDDVLYVCYDNEAYMNTGVQRSGATPPAARTATTKPVGGIPGNVFGQGKNLPLIAMAHEIPYVATATVAELRDLEYKVERAMEFRGPRYLHVFVPCPLGWGSASRDTIRIARLAKETGLFPVFEAEEGEVKSSSKIRRQVPVVEYLKLQRRYAHLFGENGYPEVIERIQAMADRNVRRFDLLPHRDGPDLPGHATAVAGHDEPEEDVKDDTHLMRLLAETPRGPQ